MGLVNKDLSASVAYLISILDTNYYLEMLIVQMDLWSLTASEMLHGETVNFPPTEDAIWHSLITPMDIDLITQQILQIIFNAF